MNANQPDSLHAYYAQGETLPTFARLSDRKALELYAESRRSVFERRLGLPIAVFRNAEVLEFGPDSGENALALALWGARLTLVEPNGRALQQIRNYFSQFALGENLESLVENDLLSFKSDRQFDFIVAEGFIYTIDDREAWLARFAQLLRPGGLFFISYYEASGTFLELMLRALYATVRRHRPALSSGEVAARLFQPKWDAIPHTRRFEAWVMDVLENPFVRLRYFYDAKQLCEHAAAHGFGLHASWPIYKDPLTVYWHKAQRSERLVLEESGHHIDRCRLSYLFGQQCFLVGDRNATDQVQQQIGQMLVAIDRQIDVDNTDGATQCAKILDEFAGLVDGQSVFIESGQSRRRVLELITSMKNLCVLLASNDVDAIEAHCQSDEAFIQSWGLPSHQALFMKRGEP